MLNGYMGKVLWVDLGSQTCWDELLDEKICRQYIGGYGLGAKIIFDKQKAGVDPLGPENILGFVTGVLTGTPALGASRYAVVGKSPLTGTWGDANSGGDFGPALRFAGYDAVFVRGIAEKPVYIFIDNGKAWIKDASHIWGKDTYETEDILKKELGEDVESACIGPSAEKLSLIAAVINNKGRAAGRSGLGALMGSKKLKALAVKGNLKIPLFDEAKASEMRKKYAAELTGPVVGLRAFGTPSILERCAASGDSPVKNWAGAITVDFPQYAKIGGNAVIALQEKRYGCYRCVVGCGGHMKAGSGEYKYPAGSHKPEYETLAIFGTNLLNDNLESIIMANDICNRYGLDTISAGATIAYAIECYDKGLITKQDTDGLEMTWGNHRSIISMLEKMARREGFGHILADGTQKAAERIGKGSEQYAMHIHGQEYSAHDPRRSYPFSLAYRMDATPGRHTRDSGMPLAGLAKPPFDPNSFAGRAPAQKVGVSFFHVIDSCGCCHFVIGSTGKANIMIDFINAATGWDMTVDEALRTGERIANMRHCFNVREGLNLIEYHSPDRMLGKPPLTAGPTAGKTVDEEMVVREFCQAMDWDLKTARPSRQKLSELDMDFAAKAIWGK
jgi:aldehyde:ferredoxin oxidoreductase